MSKFITKKFRFFEFFTIFYFTLHKGAFELGSRYFMSCFDSLYSDGKLVSAGLYQRGQIVRFSHRGLSSWSFPFPALLICFQWFHIFVCLTFWFPKFLCCDSTVVFVCGWRLTWHDRWTATVILVCALSGALYQRKWQM